MKPRLVELVDVIMRHVEEKSGMTATENGLRSWLKGQGYKSSDIDAAMKMVWPYLERKHEFASASPGSIRILSPWEALKLSSEARAALVRLEMYQLILPHEREMILEQLNSLDGEVGIEELDYLLSWVVCSNRDVESQQTIFNVLDNGENTLH